MLGVGSAGPTGEVRREAESPATADPVRTARPRRLTERQTWALLASVGGLGPVGFGALLRRFGSGRAILDAALGHGAVPALVAAGMNDDRETFGPSVAKAIVALAEDPYPRLPAIELPGVAIVTTEDDAYPPRLRAIDMPPHVLFISGDPAALSARRAIAIVGTRRPSDSGRLAAAKIAGAIAGTGATIVSGLAVGIDGAGHAAATDEGGATVAVLGSGHARLYPSAHASLARKIVAHGGAIVSELVPDTHPSGSTFPRRNRLISGLADATIVVEAGLHSGALITADWALLQGRDLFFVPGPIDRPSSAGCLAWLRQYPEAARIVAGIPELITDLRLDSDPAEDRPPGARPSLEAELIELGSVARAIAVELVNGRTTLDELVVATGQATATILGALTMLELRGLAVSAYGRYRPAGRLASSHRRTERTPPRARPAPQIAPEDSAA
jgi:DNA processing protein